MEQLSANGLTAPMNGANLFNVRVRDQDGKWGPLYKSVINVDGPDSMQNYPKRFITATEYFWDNDPGEGNGVLLPAADGNFNESLEKMNFAINNFPADGVHAFKMRAMDNQNKWGPVYTQVIEISRKAILNLKVYIEGYYDSLSHQMRNALYEAGIDHNPNSGFTDTLMIQLHDAVSPYSISQIFTGLLHTDGTVTCNYPLSVIGNSYYLSVIHQNALETWSHNPIVFSDTAIKYDFSISAAQAYNDEVNPPMKMVSPGIWALYSGDVNRDGTIDILDMVRVDNLLNHFPFGYESEDLNGDGSVDILDMSYIDNNNQRFLFYARPY